MYQQAQGHQQTTPAPSPLFHQKREKTLLKLKTFLSVWFFTCAKKKKIYLLESWREFLKLWGYKIAWFLKEHVPDQQVLFLLHWSCQNWRIDLLATLTDWLHVQSLFLCFAFFFACSAVWKKYFFGRWNFGCIALRKRQKHTKLNKNDTILTVWFRSLFCSILFHFLISHFSYSPFYVVFNMCPPKDIQTRINLLHMSLHPPLFSVLEKCKPLRVNSLPQGPVRVCSARAVPAISQTAAHSIRVDSLHLAQFLPAVSRDGVWGTLVCPLWCTQREAHGVFADSCLSSEGLMWSFCLGTV